jgi:Domain of unknown function (DUF4124)
MSGWRIAVWLSVLWVGVAGGQIYKWTDRQGNTHFTDNPSSIPPEFQSKVEVDRATPPAPLPAARDDAAQIPPTEAAAPSQSPSAAPPKDRLGRGPDYWQQLAQYWVTQRQQYLAARDRLQLMYRSIRSLASSTRNTFDRGRLQAELARLEKAMADVEVHISEAETMLRTTLPLEARRMGADLDWLMPPGMTQP